MDDSENFTITIVKRVVFMIVNTITMVDLLNISIHNAKIKHGFLKFYEISQFWVAIYVAISFQEIFVGKLAHISN